MSGIYGEVRYDGGPVTGETMSPIAAAMSFRGPDGQGQWVGDGAGLGHLMLHVTPESRHERLPASLRAAPHLVITADARIDNRDDLFRDLGVPAAGRDRTPDSSLILLAYERWGPDSVKRLLGDFAFAIWDSRGRRLFCARDPFGCVPFVYHDDGKRFIFASEVKGVLALMESPRLHEPLLAAYLQMKTYYAEKSLTFSDGVVKLPPAHTLTLTAAGARLSRYWSPEESAGNVSATGEDYAEQMRFLLQQSVECRLRSAFPAGSHLSGGLDSSATSIVAARALHERGQKLEVFSWSPPPEPGSSSDPGNEYARIESVCRQESLACHYLPVMAENYFESFQRDFTVEPVEMLAREGNVQDRAKARKLRVLLSGWGGDEAVSAAPRIPSNPVGVMRDFVVSRLPDSFYELTGGNPWIRHRFPCIRRDFAREHEQGVKNLRGPAWRRLPGVRETICRRLEFGSIVKRLEHWEASGARHGLVYRYPMLDRRLVEFVLAIPAGPREPGLKRPLFQRAVDGLLPTGSSARMNLP